MESVLKRRMTATQQASELEIGNEAYEKLFHPKVPAKQPMIRDIPMDKLVSFFTADIGFHPYSPERLNAFAAQLAEEGLFERIIVRPSFILFMALFATLQMSCNHISSIVTYYPINI